MTEKQELTEIEERMSRLEPNTQMWNHLLIRTRELEAKIKKDAETPFTPEEQEIMDLLVLAHNKLTTLGNHKSDIQDWVHHIHGCQNVLISRVVRRDYPDIFN